MENIAPQPPTIEQKIDWEYRKKDRELKIGRMRASVVRKQITEAYEILENIRFDFLGDTAFRDKIVDAKIGLERALGDFLLEDSYWKECRDKHHKTLPAEWYYAVHSNQGSPTMQSGV